MGMAGCGVGTTATAGGWGVGPGRQAEEWRSEAEKSAAWRDASEARMRGQPLSALQPPVPSVPDSGRGREEAGQWLPAVAVASPGRCEESSPGPGMGTARRMAAVRIPGIAVARIANPRGVEPASPPARAARLSGYPQPRAPRLPGKWGEPPRAPGKKTPHLLRPSQPHSFSRPPSLCSWAPALPPPTEGRPVPRQGPSRATEHGRSRCGIRPQRGRRAHRSESGSLPGNRLARPGSRPDAKADVPQI